MLSDSDTRPPNPVPQALPLLALDLERYRPYLEDLDVTDAQAEDF